VSAYRPPCTLTGAIVGLVADIGEWLGRYEAQQEREDPLRLRRINRIRSITGSLAIEGNTLSEAQITAILDGKPVIAPPREILEARNALAVYEALTDLDPYREADLLAAHQRLMQGLIDSAGRYRRGGVGVMAGQQVLHMAPPARQVERLMHQLFAWLSGSPDHPLIMSSVFHYEFEFIHPFADGNGRMGRLWQTLLLSRWRPRLAHLPVESLVHRHQVAYYDALQRSNEMADCAPFVEFMLTMIRDALRENVSPQASPQASPQVLALLRLLDRERSRAELQAALGLKDRKSFRLRYLHPALDGGWIESTRPGQPSSPAQGYRRTVLGAQLLSAHSGA
jgi:Fic family protein